jgi:GntR family transcriptional regulator
MNAVDDLYLRLPLYQRLRNEIAQQIAHNKWRPGEAIPTEAELAASHGMAIGTVRKALDALVADGMIERRQGRGTFVRRPNFEKSLSRFFRYQAVDGARIIPEGRILDREALDAPSPVRSALRLRKNEVAIRLSRLRLIRAKPVLSEEIWLPSRRFSALLDAEAGEIGDLLYPAYERLCGEIVARAEETLTVGTATAEDARLFGLEERAPVVVIDRMAFGYDNQPIEWRHSRGPTADFRYKIEIR